MTIDWDPDERLTRLQERSLDDVVGRAQALHAVLDIIHGAPVDAVYAALAAFGADRWLSDAERDYLARVVDGRPVVDAEYQLSWRAEALYALVWMLGLAPELPPTRALDIRPEHFRPVDASHGPPPPGLRLRPAEAIAAKLDELRGSRELQRRRALEWYLVADREWDDVRLDA